MMKNDFEDKLLGWFDGLLSPAEETAFKRELEADPLKQRIFEQYRQLDRDLTANASYLAIPSYTEQNLFENIPSLQGVNPMIPVSRPVGEKALLDAPAWFSGTSTRRRRFFFARPAGSCRLFCDSNGERRRAFDG